MLYSRHLSIYKVFFSTVKFIFLQFRKFRSILTLRFSCQTRFFCKITPLLYHSEEVLRRRTIGHIRYKLNRWWEFHDHNLTYLIGPRTGYKHTEWLIIEHALITTVWGYFIGTQQSLNLLMFCNLFLTYKTTLSAIMWLGHVVSQTRFFNCT